MHPEFPDDFILIDHLDVYGTYEIADLISPEELAALARMTNEMERNGHMPARDRKVRGRITATRKGPDPKVLRAMSKQDSASKA